ncbi:dicarboxylate/amino acid:cation symporter [Cesiribacter andamanensis]|uniref:Glutamate-aspartate carrier protein n=1 Tax=Cesiribacter andamanensis AMV16 TaxID=1279009 RepID=M7N0T8_9BACT|nr:dicarboxylate/amino acid:cation symporter [Cesiribacter andamanensis]EMR00816.1 Glutamate-aspartate carrier protein [Cesiribacter andamanensis AMV16]
MRRIPQLPLYLQIGIGLLLGLVWGLVSAYLQLDPAFTTNFIKPIGTIFINLLKMIAVPLVLASLLLGVASLSDVRKLSRIGGKTIAIYMGTTIVAITLGLLLVNLVEPGTKLPEETRQNLMSLYSAGTESRLGSAEALKKQSVIQPLIDMVPDNITAAFSDNTRMLQVVFFAVLMGIALIKVQQEKRTPVLAFFDGLNEAVLKMVELVMLLAPLGVFALIASLITETAGDNIESAFSLLSGLLWYSGTVLLGLALMVLVVYPLMLRFFTTIPVQKFFEAIRPVQLLAFSTSSSNATLPLTMQRTERELEVSEEVSSFVLPLGATINMDGTSLYQGVAAVFIAQALGIDLSLGDQLMILLTATLASIGSAGVPGAGLVMLVIVLEAIGVPAAGIALILAVDRILDMFRTVVNVTGDVAVAAIIAASEQQQPLREREEKIETPA